MAAIYSNGGNRWNILGFNFTKRDALSSLDKISMGRSYRPIIGGDVYSYIRVLPDGFLLKAIVFTVCEHKYMNIHPPPHYRV
jgi:hypothetical protein